MIGRASYRDFDNLVDLPDLNGKSDAHRGLDNEVGIVVKDVEHNNKGLDDVEDH